ncbi:hypothetical protein CHLRE_10g436450v5 [Chlamydomonas reinhardtii]|uniref:L-ornithine N(5)-oxygenase n=1 Tax=Chlamydomonas reinhardtii TaxID=3055 RepID=A0A2K3DA79_CHLRE|nr:uncharacterized protein CHLRE_10g436450v5 [Chlamydomonas reinhardtii]XP_042920125.1 uncharacterized protein CHLRE_10g436450v5 [Chlamydomonas reinhardtii]PNW77436.1 hypothetical protein CHLRE_10g436450v5 [Chlamydomonas reinhardtii]PNW77437.1 hypothetical protein CHLRE_10g436450v5 [Chlamydomonas reinhardtii]
MSRWDEQFAGLGIAHLRSPSSVHPDPSSSYSLEMWAEQRRRCCELRPMEVMGKSADFRGPFDLPGTSLFRDFVGAVVRRYCLDSPGAVRRAKVLQLTPVPYCEPAAASTTSTSTSTSSSAGTAPPRYSHCVATLSDGSQVAARRVLLAVGSTNVPRLPPFAHGWVVAPTPPTPVPVHASSTSSATCMPTDMIRTAVGDTADEAAPADAVEPQPPSQLPGPNKVCLAQPKPQYLHSDNAPDNFTQSGPYGDAQQPVHLLAAAEPAAALHSEPAAAALVKAVESAAAPPPPWAGRMLHAWEVARCFSCRKPRALAHSGADNDCGAAASAAAAGGRGCSGGADSSCRSLAGQRVVVVGGGLTAAQLVALAAQHGSTDVVMLVRRKLQVKQFDVDVHWLGRMRQAHLHDFGRLAGGPAARLAALRAAVGGGSTTPEAAAVLRALQAKGVLRVEEEVEVEAADWSECCCVPPGGFVPPTAGARSTGSSGRSSGSGDDGSDCSSSSASEDDCSPRTPSSRGSCGSPRSPSTCGRGAGTAAAACARGYGSLPWAPHRAAGCWHLYLSRPLERPQYPQRHQGPAENSGTPGLACRRYGDGDDDDSEGGLLLHADHVWCATGSVVDAGRDPLLRRLQAQCRVELHGGLPELTPELRWCEGLDVFVAGAYAALRLGPGAGNLMGARTAAVRLVRLWQREAGADLCPYIKPPPPPQQLLQLQPQPAAQEAGDEAPEAVVANSTTASAVIERRPGLLAMATSSRRRPKGRKAAAEQAAAAAAVVVVGSSSTRGQQPAGPCAQEAAGGGGGTEVAEAVGRVELQPAGACERQALCYCDTIVRRDTVITPAA